MVDGTNGGARFNGLWGIAVDNKTNLYVTDTDTIRKTTPNGTNWVVTTIAGSSLYPGTNDGSGTRASFEFPYAIAADKSTNLFVAESGNASVRKVSLVGAVWVVKTIAGGSVGSNNGVGTNAQFNGLSGIAVDTNENIYVADSLNDTIREAVLSGSNWNVGTLAGLPGQSGTSDLTGTDARFNHPEDVAADGAGGVYVADTVNNTIRHITSVGATRTVAGAIAGSVDGTGSTARFAQPEAVTVDSFGDIFAVDTANSTIREITSAGVVSTLAGLAGNQGSADGVGSHARFNSPTGIAMDGAGNLFVSDTHNKIIRKITPAGVVNVLGNAQYINIYPGNTVDGTGTNAQFGDPPVSLLASMAVFT